MTTIRMMPTHPITDEMPIGAFLRYTKNPKAIASRMNRIDIIAVDSLAARAAPSIAAPAALVLPKVLATMDAKAATTRSSVR